MNGIARLELIGRIFAWCMALAMLLLAAYTVRDLYSRIVRPPPFEYSQDVYVPLQTVVCPGQALRWKSSLIVRKVPTVLYSTQVVWSVQLGRAWEPSHRLNMYIWTETEADKPISRPASYVLPLDLPPGPYELRVGAGALNTDSDAYKVPFMVGNGTVCPTKRSP